MTEQRVVLEHEPDAALARGHVGDVPAMQRDAAVVDARQAGDGAQQRALAAAARTQQHEEFAVADVDGDVVDDGCTLVALGDLVERDGHDAAMLPVPAAAVRAAPLGGYKPVIARRAQSTMQHAFAGPQHPDQRFNLRALRPGWIGDRQELAVGTGALAHLLGCSSGTCRCTSHRCARAVLARQRPTTLIG